MGESNKIESRNEWARDWIGAGSKAKCQRWEMHSPAATTTQCDPAMRCCLSAQKQKTKTFTTDVHVGVLVGPGVKDESKSAATTHPRFAG